MTAPADSSTYETQLLIRSAARAALTVIARTVPLSPAGRGEHFRGLHAAHAAYRTVYAAAEPQRREAAICAWADKPTPTGDKDYREGYDDFTNRIKRILDGSARTIATVLVEDLEQMPLERV